MLPKRGLSLLHWRKKTRPEVSAWMLTWSTFREWIHANVHVCDARDTYKCKRGKMHACQLIIHRSIAKYEFKCPNIHLCFCPFLFACIRVNQYIHSYTNICISSRACVHIHKYACIYAHAQSHICTNVCTFECTYIHRNPISNFLYLGTNVKMYIHIYLYSVHIQTYYVYTYIQRHKHGYIQLYHTPAHRFLLVHRWIHRRLLRTHMRTYCLYTYIHNAYMHTNLHTN